MFYPFSDFSAQQSVKNVTNGEEEPSWTGPIFFDLDFII